MQTRGRSPFEIPLPSVPTLQWSEHPFFGRAGLAFFFDRPAKGHITIPPLGGSIARQILADGVKLGTKLDDAAVLRQDVAKSLHRFIVRRGGSSETKNVGFSGS